MVTWNLNNFCYCLLEEYSSSLIFYVALCEGRRLFWYCICVGSPLATAAYNAVRGCTGEAQPHSPLESEVWEVRYDNYMQFLNIGNVSSSRILPVMTCSEDGILAVVEQGTGLLLNLYYIDKSSKPSYLLNG